MTYEELKAKYPDIHHGPMPDCPRCQGAGERTVNLSFGPMTSSCLCLFLDHEHVPMATEILNQVVEDMRRDKDQIVAETCEAMGRLADGIKRARKRR